MAKKNNRNYSVLIIVIIAIILTITIGFTSGQREETTFLESLIANIISPVQETVYVSTRVVGDRAGSIFRFAAIKRENDHLKQELEEIEKELIKTRLKRDELEELRGLQFALNSLEQEGSWRPVAANIIAKAPGNWFNIFTIDAGENKGIVNNSIVLASNGLVGRVYEVSGNTSKVLSIIDNNSSVGFQVLRENNYKGILTGSITNELSGYLFDPLAEVIVGDRLITSGIGIFPKGIMIGEVIEVSRTSDQLLKTVTVEPAVNFKRMSKVLVIK